MTVAEGLSLTFQLLGVIGGALALAYYGGQWTRSIKSIESTVLELKDDMRGVINTQHAQGERLAGVEARQAVHR